MTFGVYTVAALYCCQCGLQGHSQRWHCVRCHDSPMNIQRETLGATSGTRDFWERSWWKILDMYGATNIV